MTQEEMNILVPQKLREIEERNNVTVLYAVETGSRAWGFASPDSDFDVRFIYKRTQEDYLRLDPPRDVIELPIDDVWDVSGWDLRKALLLLHKSNPSVFEWLGSPMPYITTGFEERFRPLMQMYFSEKRMLYHYLSMARNNRRNHLTGELVTPKKYLYALRPLLACQWIIEKHSAPPVLFADLTDAMLPPEMKGTLDALLEIKMAGNEKEKIPHIAEIDTYIEESITTLLAYLQSLTEEAPLGWDALNAFFLHEIRT